MKILKRGTLPGERVHQATCGTCHSEIEFTEGEARVTHDQRDGSFMQVKCPVCGATITKEWRR